MSHLETLAQHRDAILLAELAAWLHDMGKCTDEFLQPDGTGFKATECTGNPNVNPHKAVFEPSELSVRSYWSSLSNDRGQCSRLKEAEHNTALWSTLKRISIDPTILDFEVNLPGLGATSGRELILWGRPLVSDQFHNFQGVLGSWSILAAYLGRAHGAAHIEKEESPESSSIFISTPFGFECSQLDRLNDKLQQVLSSLHDYNRRIFVEVLEKNFSLALGDTRPPENEVALWEWGHTVGALYKASLVGAYFQHQLGLTPTAANDLHWRLLSIRTDGLVYLTGVSRLPDLIARQKTLQTALDNVQTLLEETYPLATEVYRDENGSLYVVPDVPNLLTDSRDKTDETLLTHILRQFDTDGEIVPEITLDAEAWWGQDPNRNDQDELPPAARILARKATIQSDPQIISAAWKKQHNEICPICGLRPRVSQQLAHCRVCGQRRQGRVQQWIQAQDTTIWLDEVADSNSRLALLIGAFSLTDWLNGKLVETLLVQDPNSDPVTKTPSFARLHRIWRTTQTFWQEIQASINEALSDSRRRLTMTLAKQANLQANKTYKLDLLGHTRMSVIWDGFHLISIDNLGYTAAQLHIPAGKRQTPADAALEVGLWLEQNKQCVFQLVSEDEKNRRFDIQIQDVGYHDIAYATAIPVLAEPRTFMALIPADKALDILQTIKEKYEREMGKVRNRLPLNLGVVYADRRTPLRVVLDAGRRMLQQQPLGGQEIWTVQADALIGTLPADRSTLANGTQHFQQTVTVRLRQNGRCLTWHIPAVMGDGWTEDNWYPYVFFHADKYGNQGPSGRSRAFKGLRPITNGCEACWLVHTSELKAEDQVYFTPATFDFEWLDTSARRFEIAYDAQGQRYGRLTRPYLLDELDVIQEAWSLIAGPDGLMTSQIHALRDIIEPRREAWQASPQEETFRQLCRDAIRNAAWRKKPPLVDIDKLTGWASNGLLADTIELYMEIMKVKPRRDEHTGVAP